MDPINFHPGRPLGQAQSRQEIDQAAETPGMAARPAGEPGEVRTAVSRMAAEGAPVDLIRIAEIRQALIDGAYVVDPAKLAAKMIELDLGGGRE